MTWEAESCREQKFFLLFFLFGGDKKIYFFYLWEGVIIFFNFYL